ncbi:flagellar hook-length control protein FliK [Paenibacillus sp. LHD-117]|uniref:flagellar hook-length control protein FliK n=1 Tax=Paenibacillus sp. LHD-117 TaxID=3071412 RepID=UPI0027E0D044|nr:flagellar hook-length control protein FliK [Paenibacillus sp. LHD-117]MDQ6419255.1 flagellar hook-length control protein FliK [Paenibacillus sp. LHD-117]
MEMILPGMMAPQSQQMAAVSQVVSKGQGGGAGMDFQQALVQQISGETGSEAAAEQSTALVSAIAQLAALAGAEGAPQEPTLEDLMAAIDGLIDQLGESSEDEAPVTEQKLEELTATLEGLNALLALLGAPIVQLQPNVKQQLEQGISVENVQEATSSVKSSLQDGLLQLQATLLQGPLKRVQGQDSFALIGQQLQAISAKLSGFAKTGETTSGKTEPGLPSWLNLQPTGAKDTHTHLQRLTQQATHPAFIQASAEAKALFTEIATQGEAQTHAGDTVQSVQMPFVSPDNVREFATLLTKSAAPSAFVLADDFADTMQGLIVQKFDIRTLNGASEAKLMLFPEHLGQVDVKISVQNGLLTAVFQTDNAVAKDMLENQMAQLRSALQAQGLNVDKLEVSQSSSAAPMSQQHFGQNHGNGQQSGDRHGFRQDENVTDAAFETEMVEQAAIQGLGYGRSINETA